MVQNRDDKYLIEFWILPSLSHLWRLSENCNWKRL